MYLYRSVLIRNYLQGGKTKYGLLLFGLLFLLQFCSIENSPNYNKEPASFISAVHKGCDELYKSTGGSYLEDYYFTNDTLCLTIHFTANCCPEFIDSTVVTPGHIKLYTRDTLSGCRCICDYSDDFKFVYGYEGNTRLEFWQANLHNEFSLGFETTFQSQP